jgi:HPt (histidine-containing phosphotransfer) domain-containing protein
MARQQALDAPVRPGVSRSNTDMKTLYEEMKSRSRELFGSRRQAPQQHDDPPALAVSPGDDLQLETLAREFSRELYAQLLLELPAWRRMLIEAFAAGDYRRLGDGVHKILGAAAYCQACELEQELRQLRLALNTADSSTIEYNLHRTIRVIDSTLRCSGLRDHTA